MSLLTVQPIYTGSPEHTTQNDVVTIISTMPLTSNEIWTKLASGEAILFKNGEISQSFSS